MPARIKRQHRILRQIRKGKERETALEALLQDFENRCAYSMLHVEQGGGVGCFEVDHFNPKRKSKDRQAYSNLYLVHRPCNRAKSDTWPTKAQQRKGLRFLDPCSEEDYDVVVFEDPQSGALVGTTNAARWHIEMCGLNSEYLKQRRRERTELLHKWQEMNVRAKRTAPLDGIHDALRAFGKIIDVLIRPIAPPETARGTGPEALVTRRRDDRMIPRAPTLAFCTKGTPRA